MDDLTKILTAVFGGIVLIAIASVVVSKKSQAPQAIQSVFSGIGNVVAAAVNPVSANYGYGTGAQASTSPGSILTGGIADAFTGGNITDAISNLIPGGFK